MEASENATHRHENKYKKRKKEKEKRKEKSNKCSWRNAKSTMPKNKLNKCSSMKMIDHSQRKKDAEKSINWKMNERSLDDLLSSVDQIHSMLQMFVDIEHIDRVIVRFSINN